MKLKSKKKSIFIFIVFFSICNLIFSAPYKNKIKHFKNWLESNQDPDTGLPYSHVGDDRFEKWCLLYDSSVTSIAYISLGNIEAAKRIINFYMNNILFHRLGGIIEAIDLSEKSGSDYSVRTGANIWLGIASYHLYKVTGESVYLNFSEKIADFAIKLQNKSPISRNQGGIRLGPLGDPIFVADQKINYDKSQPDFYFIYSSEVNIDAFALFNFLSHETESKRYLEAKNLVFKWITNIAYNKEENRFNRGYYQVVDTAIATDVQSWAISSLGIDNLSQMHPDLADNLFECIKSNCMSKVSYSKPGGKTVKIYGCDFIDKKTAYIYSREPIVSPEWTFQFINALRILENHYKKSKNRKKEKIYKKERKFLIKQMIKLAVKTDTGLSYPYATKGDAVIGHQHNTPKDGNLSTIGVSYAILALKGFDPLHFES